MTVRLETERLVIRSFTLDDAERFHNTLGDERVMARIPSGVSPSVEDTKERIKRIMDREKRDGFSLMAIIEKYTDEIIGNCGLILVEGEGPEVEVSYDIAFDRWNRGYATEASIRVVRWGFEEKGLQRILAMTYPDHHASIRVIEKLGMVRRGIEKHYGHQLVVFEISRADQ
jgi:ribosomal-protein-alanine N-acetyltransferase